MESFGKYNLVQRIAKGGMAEIFLATQQGPAGFEKQLVIKRILPHLASDDAFITMFLDEARLAARLAHPNLVQIFELGQEGASYYIAMEHVRGPSISSVIRKLKEHGLQMPLHYAAWIVAKAAAGLDYAHSLPDETGTPLGLVHRDVSPDNVLITEQGSVKMIDFGVAKARTNETKTIAGTVKGKLRYMSPEQVQGKAIDGRSDLFSLGIVLYELSTLSRPFSGASELATVSAIVTEAPEPASNAVAGFPPALEAIISKALAKDPDDRYTTARDMQSALEAFVHSRGDYLTEHEVGSYLSRLFSTSEEEIATLRAIPSGLHTAVHVDPYQLSQKTQPATPMAMARHETLTEGAAEPEATAPARASVIPPDDVPPKGKGGLIALFVALLLVLGGGGFALWHFVLSEQGAEPAAAATAEGATDAPKTPAPDEPQPDEPQPDEPQPKVAVGGVDVRSPGPAPRRRDLASAAGARGGLEPGPASASAPDVAAPAAAADVATPAAAVDVATPAAAVDVATPEAAVDVAAPEAAVDVAAPEAAVDVVAPEAAVDVVAPEAAVDVAVPEAAVDVAAPEAAPDIARTPEVATPAEPVVAKRSYLTVKGPKGSLLYINGRKFGRRVNTRLSVKPGRHNVVVRPPRTRAILKASVRLAPGESKVVRPR